MGKIDINNFWVDEIQKLPENERVVLIAAPGFNMCAFSVNISKFDDSSYLINFSDISESMIELIKLEDKIIHDKLTGAFNREYFESKNSTFIEECKNTNMRLGLGVIDIDFFKKINDTYGHDIGDSVLIELVNIISKENDVLFRWGGEEFIVILKLKSEKNLYDELENYRIKVEKHNFKYIGNLTCSLGGSIYKDNEKIEKTIKRADIALYEAKASGRNKTIIEL